MRAKRWRTYSASSSPMPRNTPGTFERTTSTTAETGIGDQGRLQPAANARRNRLFRGRMVVANALGRGLNRVRGLERFDLFGELRNARPRFRARLRVRAGKAGLELVAQGGQRRKIGVVKKGLAQPCLVVTQLGFRNGQVLPGTGTVRLLGFAQAFHRFHD